MERQPASAKKIGIIEDDQGISTTLQLLLEDEGYTTFHLPHNKIQDEATFQRFIRRHRPPLVLFDIPYPYDINWELYQKLIHSKGNSRRTFLPMGAFDSSFEKQLQNSGQQFLAKPFDIDEFTQLIQDTYPHPRTRRSGGVSFSVPAQQNLLIPTRAEAHGTPVLRRIP